MANPDLAIRSSGILRHNVYHSTRREDFWIRFALELGTSQMPAKKHYDLLQNLCHAVNVQQLFVAQKPIMESHKTGVKWRLGYSEL